ncbi:hypothetical protein B9479_003730 [Cryptococcus floricola]|uniref:RRM domain-containing protein n=1 Tax=Cryptococcus floricola TaxID=2591691 RepID=A0A5D3AZV4_9TREE|nr:hypothetical protein B9479_003730 [Cryptococcus floricola]
MLYRSPPILHIFHLPSTRFNSLSSANNSPRASRHGIRNATLGLPGSEPTPAIPARTQAGFQRSGGATSLGPPTITLSAKSVCVSLLLYRVLTISSASPSISGTLVILAKQILLSPYALLGHGVATASFLLSSKSTLPKRTRPEQAFGEFGTVIDCIVVRDRETGRSRGFGLATFSTPQEAEAAISAMNEQDLDGRRVRVNLANSRGGGGGGVYGGGGHGGGGGFRSNDGGYGGFGGGNGTF